MLNALSIDLEDWFCCSNVKGMEQLDWNKCESRIEKNTFRILDLLKKADINATFFVLGYIAQRNPDLVRKIADGGHEIASHGFNHLMITHITEVEFRDDLEKSLNAISKITNQSVIGFRAPAFTITETTLWALDILKEYGFQYDSSIYPINIHPQYGFKDANLEISQLGNGLIEVPLACAKYINMNIPCGGGAYLRFYPYFITKQLIQKCINQGRPAVIYIHPWEFDTGMPKIKLNLLSKVRHYYNLENNRIKLDQLLEDFKFTSIKNLLDLRNINININ
jgi:polysaccharide deacetylase family protein (PEP-CTERM system associated)